MKRLDLYAGEGDPPHIVFGLLLQSTQPRQNHLALAFSAPDRNQKLHLAWHCRMRLDDITRADLGAYVHIRLPLERAEDAIACCLQVFRANTSNQIPYGFGGFLSRFHAETGEYQALGQSGMTCATFVLSVLDYAGIQVLRAETWEMRDDDRMWQDHILADLKDRVSPEYHSAMSEDLPAFRFRPEEISAAALTYPRILSFRQAACLGQRIVERVAGRPPAS